MYPTAATRGHSPGATASASANPGKRTERFLRIADVADIVGLGRTTIYRYIREHGFPSPIPLGGQRVAWLESEVRTWMQNRVDRRPAGVTAPQADGTTPDVTSIGLQSAAPASHNPAVPTRASPSHGNATRTRPGKPAGLHRV